MDIKQGDFENILMNAVWELEDSFAEQIDVSEVQEKINSSKQSWAYTTVKTVLDRLVKKDMLERIKFNNKFFYKSVISREDAGMKAMEKIVKQYYKGDIDSFMNATAKFQAGMLVTR